MAPDDINATGDFSQTTAAHFSDTHVVPVSSQDALDAPSDATMAYADEMDDYDEDEAMEAMRNLEARRYAKKRAKRIRIAAIAGAVALALGGFALFRAFAKPSAETTDEPETAIVERRDYSMSVSGSGALAPYDSVVVTPEVSGIIESVNVSVGQRVNIGEVLFTIRSEELDKAIATASESLTSAQRSLDSANESIGRLQSALDSDRAAHDEAQEQAADESARATAAYEETYAKHEGLLNELRHGVDTAKDDARIADAAAAAAEEAYLKAVEDKTSTQELINQLAQERDNARGEAEAKHVALKEAEASLADAETQAVNDAKKASEVVPVTTVPEFSEASAQAQIESARATAESAQASVEKAQKEYDEAVANAEKRVVRAPSSGSIVTMNAQAGAGVGTAAGSAAGSKSADALITIADVSKMKVTVNVNELDILNIKEGQKATCTFSAVKDLTLEGRVTSVATTAGGTGGEGGSGGGVVSFPVEILIEKLDPRVKTGMTANVKILTDDRPNSLVIPVMALVEEGATTYVNVKVDDTHSELRQVKVATKNASEAVIESGLTEGEEILLSGGVGADDETAENATPAA